MINAHSLPLTLPSDKQTVVVITTSRLDFSLCFCHTTRKLIGKPSVDTKIDCSLPQTSTIDSNALLSQYCLVICSSVCASEHVVSTCRSRNDVFEAHLGLMTPFELITRCHGTVSLL